MPSATACIDEYKDRIGEIVNGTVKRVEYGNVIVDLGRGEAIIRRDELIPREIFRYGDRVRAYIYDVRREQRGPQIFLSRTHPQFMAKLFMQEVPEIYDGIITDPLGRPRPGLPRQDRRDLARQSRSIRSAPASVCAARASRRWSANCRAKRSTSSRGRQDRRPRSRQALQPAEVAKVVLDEQAERIEVVVPDEQLSLAIGRRGQNVRLASQLIGWDIDILTEQEESERRQKEFTERSSLFMDALDVDEMVAQLLASEGFSSVEELAYVDARRNRLDRGLRRRDRRAKSRHRAREYLERHRGRAWTTKRKALGVEDELYEIPASPPRCWSRSARTASRRSRTLPAAPPTTSSAGPNARTARPSASRARFKDFPVSREEAEDMIMQARLKAGWITEADLAAERRRALTKRAPARDGEAAIAPETRARTR